MTEQPLTPPAPRGRLLVVDDDAMSLRIAKRTLEQAGFTVETATDDGEAVRAAAAAGRAGTLDGAAAVLAALEEALVPVWSELEKEKALSA